MDTSQQLKDLQNRQKALVAKRDTLIRDAGVEERRLAEAIEKLVDLGVKDAASLTPDQLQERAEALQAKLTANMEKISQELTMGEALLREYQAG
jgi:uncharacterized protein YceH (UPF0502 family)